MMTSSNFIYTYWYFSNSLLFNELSLKVNVETFSLSHSNDKWHWTKTELNYEPITIIVLDKWFLSDFFIACRPLHTRTMGLKGKNILKPNVIIFISQVVKKLEKIDYNVEIKY